MFNGKKIAAVTGLLGGLAMTFIGTSQAYAAGGPGVCTFDAEGNIVCAQRIVGQTPEGDGFTVNRTVNCQPTQPLTLPAPGLLNNGQTRIGPQITCADLTPGAPAPNSDSKDGGPLLARLLGG
ncbi:hypothetical protein [Streptomyces sp. GESEQ-35]|uniref:hypothetical protein n=1 Tax=Streptomyces sp. GESEQ-35 TaxID=2812657 RepID=UPI001B3189C1|nr:hypothetical protein [Streptomyces sp. GESEQ-35]